MTFAASKLQMWERAELLLGFGSCMPRAASAKESWAKTLPLPAMVPLLQRWSSTGGPAGGAPPTPPAGGAGATAAAGVGDGGDSKAEEGVSPADVGDLSAILTHYVLFAIDAPPAVVAALAERRRTRAKQRAFGLQAQRAFLGSLSFSSAACDCLLWLRPSMRGRVQFMEELEVEAGQRPGQVDTAGIRHHYMKGLAACSRELTDTVQASFVSLFTEMGELLLQAAADSDPGMAHVIMWNWGLDFEPQDHEFLLRVGIVPSLHRMITVKRHHDRALLDTATGAGTADPADAAAWVPWSVGDVRSCLRNGAITKRELLEHMHDAPRARVPQSFWASSPLDGDISHVARTTSIDVLLRHYTSFVDTYFGVDAAAATAPVTRIQAAFRGHATRSKLSRWRSGLAPFNPDGEGEGEAAAGGAAGGAGAGAGSAAAPAPAAAGVAASAMAEVRCGVSVEHEHIRTTALALFDLLTTFSFGVSRRHQAPGDDGAADADDATAAAGPASRFTTQLGALALQVREEELLFAARYLQELAASGGNGTSDGLHERVAFGVEQVLYQHLTFVLSATSTPTGLEFASRPSIAGALFSMLSTGSPRVQRSACRVLEVVLPALTAAQAAAVVAATGMDTMNQLVKLLLSRVARAMCVAAPTAGTAMPPRPNHVAGHMSLPPAAPGYGYMCMAAAGDTTGLLRHMASSPAWKAAVSEVVVAALLSVVSVVGTSGTGDVAETAGNRVVMADACAALCVLGGNIEVLRPGCKVALANHAGVTATADALNQALLQHAWEGTVVVYSPFRGNARVLFGGTAGVVDIQELPVAQLVPVASVPADPHAITLSRELLDVLFRLVEVQPTPSGGSSVPSKPSAPGGESAPATTTAVEVWKAEVNARALEAVLHLVQRKDTATQILRGALLAKLLNEALVPVALPQFVSLNSLQRRAALMRTRLLERGVGLRYGGGADSGGDLSEADRRRQQVADGLSTLGFPTKLCIKALVLHNDDPDRAANWLMSNGADVFVRGGGLEEDTSDTTPRGAAAKQLGLVMGMPPKLCYHALELSGDDENRATLWLMDNGSFYADKVDESGDSSFGSDTGTKAVADSAVIEGIDDSEAGLVADHQRQSLRHVFGRRRRGRGDNGDAGGKAEEGDEAKDGDGDHADAGGAPEALLQLVNAGAGVAPGAGLQGGVTLLYTRHTGIVERLCDVGVQGAMIPHSAVGNAISLRIVDVELAKLREVTVSLDQVRVVTTLYGHKVAGAALIRQLAVGTEMALATHAARRAVLSLLLTWPAAIPLTLRAMGGAAQLVNMSKFVASSEHVFDARDGQAGPGFSPLTDVLRSKLRWFLMAEASGGGGGERGAGGGSWACEMCTLINPMSAAQCSMCNSNRPAAPDQPAQSSFAAGSRGEVGERLSAVLVRDCVWNVVQSTSPGDATDKEEHESLHPFYPQCEYQGEIKFPGAKAIMVKFDPRCTTGDGAVLEFKFTDKRRRTRQFQGGPEQFQNFVMHADKCTFRFRSKMPADHGLFGYRFRVSPMRGLQWLNEPQVLSDPSLEWACWLLNFLLNDGAKAVGQGVLHNASLFNALVRYIRTPGCPYKERVIGLLTQLLRSPHLFNTGSPPDFAAVRGLSNVVFVEVERRRNSPNGLFLPQRLQALVELSVVSSAAERAMASGTPPRVPFDEAQAYLSGTSGFLGIGGRARKLRVPVQKCLPPPEPALTLPATLSIVFDLAECLVLRARLPDALTCRAHLDACGLPESTPAARLDTKKLCEAVGLIAEWDQADDEELVEWAQTIASRASSSLSNLTCDALKMTPRDEVSYPVIARKSSMSRKLRFAVLRMFNRRLAACIELLDTNNTEHAWSIGHQLRALGHIIFGDTKTRLVEAAVEKTWAPGHCGISLTLDNQAAFASMDAGKVDPAVSKCLFVQCFGPLNSAPVAKFRCKLDEKARLFRVSFRGEDGMDWGGLFRDAMTRMVEDCFSDHFNLLIPCPNARSHNGVNTDKYIPNPIHTSPRTVQMFEFLGKLMGISMRHKLYLPFELPSLVWKPLVGQPLTGQDIRDIDEAVFDNIESIRKCESHGITNQASFDSQFFVRSVVCLWVCVCVCVYEGQGVG